MQEGPKNLKRRENKKYQNEKRMPLPQEQCRFSYRFCFLDTIFSCSSRHITTDLYEGIYTL